MNERKKNKKEIEMEAQREVVKVFHSVLIQAKLMLCDDRTGYHLPGFCCPPRGFGSGGVSAFLLCLTTAQHLTPCFLNCCQSLSELDSVSDMY